MDGLLRARAVAAGNVFTTADAAECGHDARSLRRLVASGECVRIGRGRYAVGPLPLRPEDEHVARTRAALLTHGNRVAASHHSALLLHGLPVFGADLSVVHLTRLADRHTRRSSGIAMNVRPAGTQVLWVDSCAVVDACTALVQLAMAHGILPAVVSADAALHHGTATGEQLAAAVDRIRGIPGSRAARHMLSHADSRSESVGESRLRLGLLVHRLPVVPQHEIREAGEVVARVDSSSRGHASWSSSTAWSSTAAMVAAMPSWPRSCVRTASAASAMRWCG
ncbi:type IV toxin-antitoxin system AbiEi family antitoxin domain-containing protein [Oryzihumus leptocrescens]|nr:type IV toxin-antitoxin system AbiEi family antitoxin domain-containing protein [Oryzihumus leptocrescens]